MTWRKAWVWAKHIAVGAAVGLAAIIFGTLATGCTTVYRLGPGENLVIRDGQAVICAGAGCKVERVWR